MSCIKQISLIIIVISFSFIGYLKTIKLRTRLKTLEVFLEFLQYIKTEISYSSLSLYEIISTSNNDFSREIIKKSLYFSLPTAFSKVCNSFFVNKCDTELALKFMEEFGRYDIESQTEIIDISVNKIVQNITYQKSYISQKSKINIVFYSFLGIAIALILL